MPNIFGAGGGAAGNILGMGGSAMSLLDAARTSYRGVGLSARARAMSASYLNQSSAGLNAILAGGMAKNGTTEVLLQKIKAIRASLPENQIRADIVAADNADNGKAAASSNGASVNRLV